MTKSSWISNKVYLPLKQHKIGDTGITCKSKLDVSKNSDLSLGKLKTIIFDMDETLIHKVDASDKRQEADVYIQIPSEDSESMIEVSQSKLGQM